MMRTIPALLSLALLAAPLAAEQTTRTAQPAKPAVPQAAPAPAAASESPLQKPLDDAIHLVQTGKNAEAFKKLQAIEKDPNMTPLVLSLIGALYVEIGKPAEGLRVLKPLADAEDAQPAVLYNAGRAALRAGQVDEGRVYLTRSVLKQPDSPAARELGMLTAHDGRVVEAYSMLRPWALHNPNDTEARLMAADLAVQLERGDDAIQLLSGFPDSEPAVRLLRGKALVLKKDGPGAVALLKPLLTSHPQGMDLEVRRSLAEAELLAGQPAEAIKLIDGRVAGHPALVLLLARAQRQAGNGAAAFATLKPLADKLPVNPDTIPDPRPAAGIALEYGTLLLEGGHTAEAVSFCQKATVYNPRSIDAWKAYARALDAAGRKDEAQKALAQATALANPPARQAVAGPAPSAPPAAAAGEAQEQPLSEGLQKALQMMSQGQLEPALTAARQEVAVSKDPRARMIEVRILLALHRPEEALKASEAAVAIDPLNPDFIYMKGASEMGLQRISSAEQDFRKTLQLQPRHLAAMNDLAVLLLRTNKKEEARKLLRQVLQINPQDQVAAANLKKLDGEAQ